LKVFEKWVLWGIFGPEGEEGAGGWRRLHNEGLHDLYVSVTKSKRIRWAGHAAGITVTELRVTTGVRFPAGAGNFSLRNRV